jgi:uncharacterized protein (DUF362 family)
MTANRENPGAHSRREFLRIAGASAIGAVAAPGLFAGSEEAGTITATVGIAKSQSVAEAVRDAVAMSGGLDFIKPGQKVLIKPNQAGPVKHPATTNPEVLYEVCKLVAEAGCENIFLSDRGFVLFKDGTGLMKTIGHYDAAKQAETDVGGGVKVTPVAFHEAGPYLTRGSPLWREIHHPLARHYIDPGGKDVGFKLAELLFQVDHVINVPCAKVHNQCWFTMSMKAFVGMADPTTTRTYFHGRAGKGIKGVPGKGSRFTGPFYGTEADATPISRIIAELNLGLTPALNIIDGTMPMYDGDHVTGDSVKADVIIASRDRIAADVAGIALLRSLGNEERLHSISPWQHPMVRHAQELGLGVTHRNDVTVKQKGVDNIDTLLEHMV